MKQRMSVLMRSRLPYRIDESFLDEYGHVNHAYYPLLVEAGRGALQERLGYPDSVLREKGLGLFVYRATYQFEQEMGTGEILIASAFRPYTGGVRLYMDHEIRADERVASASTEHAFVSLATRKVQRPLDEFVKALERYNS